MSFLWQLEDHDVQAYWVHHVAVPLKAPPKSLAQVLVSVFPLPFYFYSSTKDPPRCRTAPHQFPLLCFSCSVTVSAGDAWWGSGDLSLFSFSHLSCIWAEHCCTASTSSIVGFRDPWRGPLFVVSFHLQIFFFISNLWPWILSLSFISYHPSLFSPQFFFSSHTLLGSHGERVFSFVTDSLRSTTLGGKSPRNSDQLQALWETCRNRTGNQQFFPDYFHAHPLIHWFLR